MVCLLYKPSLPVALEHRNNTAKVKDSDTQLPEVMPQKGEHTLRRCPFALPVCMLQKVPNSRFHAAIRSNR